MPARRWPPRHLAPLRHRPPGWRRIPPSRHIKGLRGSLLPNFDSTDAARFISFHLASGTRAHSTASDTTRRRRIFPTVQKIVGSRAGGNKIGLSVVLFRGLVPTE